MRQCLHYSMYNMSIYYNTCLLDFSFSILITHPPAPLLFQHSRGKQWRLGLLGDRFFCITIWTLIWNCTCLFKCNCGMEAIIHKKKRGFSKNHISWGILVYGNHLHKFSSFCHMTNVGPTSVALRLTFRWRWWEFCLNKDCRIYLSHFLTHYGPNF